MLLAVAAAAAALASPLAYTDVNGGLYLDGAQLAGDTGATYQALELTPDGTSVLAVESGDVTRIVLVPVAGGDPKPVAGTDDADAASISPDGRTVAFTTPDGLFTVPVAGGAPARLVETPVDATDSLPEFSPDGRTIAFARDVVGDDGNEIATLELVPAAGGKVVARADGLVGSLALGGRISFSPDGTTLAYAGDESDPGIWLVGTQAGDPRQLTSGLDYWPVFAPDGAAITFARDAASEDSDASSDDPQDPVDEDYYELWTVPAAGGDATFQHEGDFETLAVPQIASAAPAQPPVVKVTVTRRGNRYTLRWTGTATNWKVKLVVGKKSVGAVVKGSLHQASFTLKRAKGKPVARVTPAS